MQKILIAGLTIPLIIFVILYLRERSIRKASERCNSYYEKERTSFKSQIEINKEQICTLKKENTALGKKNGKFFMAEIRYIRIFRSHKRKIISLSKKNEGLRYHLHHFEEIKVTREREYTNLN